MQKQSPITISINAGNPEPEITAYPVDTFSKVPVEFSQVDDKQQFVVGLDGAGLVRRVVSQSEAERPVVAAIVGTWVAFGLRVQHVDGYAALVRLLRKSVVAEKGQEEAKAASLDGQPVQPVETPEPTGQTAEPTASASETSEAANPGEGSGANAENVSLAF